MKKRYNDGGGDGMPNESQIAATRRYKERHIRRVALEMQKEEYERLKNHADAKRETVSGYLKVAMRERMRKEDEGDV
jgi:hypothetical protein